MKPVSRERWSEAVRFIVLLGLVSLFADMVYEGARSVLGPFLVTLGASAAAVGVISGVGEFVGYALRVVAGYAADRTQRYWALTIAGYLLTLVAVPLLGLVGRIDLAFALVIAERLGKAIRTPARFGSFRTSGRRRSGWSRPSISLFPNPPKFGSPTRSFGGLGLPE